jgi:hypothetical protein
MKAGSVRAAPSALPTAAFGALALPSRRTRRTRHAAALAAAAVLSAAAVQAFHTDWSGVGASGTRSSAGVIVLDLSGSVQRGSSRPINAALTAIERAVPADGRIGLVVFSDVGGITLPATAPKSQLHEVIRFFPPHPKQAGPVTPINAPANPWDGTFIGGTLISSGVVAGETALARAGVRGGRLFLISDLADDGSDGPIMRKVVSRLHRKGVELTILPILGAVQASPFFRTLDPSVVRFAKPSKLGALPQLPAAPAVRSSRAGSPLLLAGLVAAAGLVFLGCELAFPRLRFRREEVA